MLKLDYKIILKAVRSDNCFIVLSFLYPALFLLRINKDSYTNIQIVSTLLFIMGVALVVLFVSLCITKYLSWLKIQRPFIAFLGSSSMMLLLYIPIRDIIPVRIYVLAACAGIVLAFTLYGVFCSLNPINYALAALVLFNISAWVLQSHAKHGLITNKQAAKYRELDAIQFKTKPNVYLIILESYNSLRLRSSVYGIDNTKLVDCLNGYGYAIEGNHYSNYDFTIASLSSLFLMQHHYYVLNGKPASAQDYKSIIGDPDDNPVIQVFRRNGYIIDYSGFNPSLYTVTPSTINSTPPNKLAPIEVFGGIFAAYRILSGRDLGSNRLFCKIFNANDADSPFAALNKWKPHNESPCFSVVYAGAGHTPPGRAFLPSELEAVPNSSKTPLWKIFQHNNYWATTYRSISSTGDDKLIGIIKTIDQLDPSSVVVLLGDHGAWMYRNSWHGQSRDINENLTKNGIAPTTVTQDMFEVFAAVKWPRGVSPIRTNSHVNVFRTLFAVLSKDNSLLFNLQSNNSYVNERITENQFSDPKLYMTVENGSILSQWKPQIVAP